MVEASGQYPGMVAEGMTAVEEAAPDGKPDLEMADVGAPNSGTGQPRQQTARTQRLRSGSRRRKGTRSREGGRKRTGTRNEGADGGRTKLGMATTMAGPEPPEATEAGAAAQDRRGSEAAAAEPGTRGVAAAVE